MGGAPVAAYGEEDDARLPSLAHRATVLRGGGEGPVLPDEEAVWISAAGDATDRATWSGIPAHLIEGARSVGLPFAGYALRRPGETARRLWNAGRMLRTGGIGGFQYAPWFLERLWRGQRTAGRTIVSCFQVLPDRILDDPSVGRWFYIDGTLTQLWASPDYTARACPRASSRRRWRGSGAAITARWA